MASELTKKYHLLLFIYVRLANCTGYTVLFDRTVANYELETTRKENAAA
jgi:hypothetical protein